MATPADQRLLELLDKWLSSLDLHLKYSSLDDDTYWKMQPWVEHQRPSRWIIDLAKQKTQALRKEVHKRMESQDAGFSDALELMTFLANLVGSQHIERFIPLADTQSERWVANAAGKMTPAATEETREMPAALVDSPTLPVPTMDMLRADRTAITTTATREMPRFTARLTETAAPPVTTDQVTRVERKSAPAEEPEKPAAKSTPVKQSAKPGTSKTPPKPSGRGAGRADAPPPVSGEMSEQIIADAARLMQWGRKWYELAELISRMADRPPLPDVRRVLKDQKAAIEKLAGR
jgi:hypothetical protein